MSRSHSIGVLPWRRVISRNSLTDCEVCSASGTPRLVAASRERRSRSSVQVSTCDGREKALDAAVLLAVVLLDEADGALHVAQPGLFVPGVLHLFAVVGVPAAGAVAETHVEAHADAAGLAHGLLAEGADLHHGRGAGAQQLGHGVGEAGAVRPPRPSPCERTGRYSNSPER